MAGNVLYYMGYHSVVNYNAETQKLRGIIEGIDDYVDFEADYPAQVEEEFHNAVDDYLIFCKEVGKKPEKEYRGSFNVRIDPGLHRRLAAYASMMGETLNHTVETAIKSYLNIHHSESDPMQDTPCSEQPVSV